MNYKELARQARIKVLEMIHRAGTSHIASNYSVIDLACVLYENLKEGDEVVWSKGWAAATIYYFLAKQGKIPQEDLDKFPNPPYLGLAETYVPGVLVSGGSMGHGLPIAVGMAFGKKRANEPGIIYCIISDGELNEGTTWESAALASNYHLDNLTVLIDKNSWQAMGRTEDILNIIPQKVFESFGWRTKVIDGHKFKDIEQSLELDNICYYCNSESKHLFGETHKVYRKEPKVIICNTIKGKGVSFFENHLLYHYKHVDDEEYKKALAELT